MIYASATELARHLDPDSSEPPAVPLATVLLTSASRRVRRATRAARYATDPEGYPTDSKVSDAMRDATLAQAGIWALLKLDPRLGATQIARRVASKGASGVSVSYVADSVADSALSQLADDSALTDEAFQILDEAGLISNQVGTLGYSGGGVYVDERAYDLTTGRLIE